MLAANIDYINDSITDCQATIMQLEETKVPTGPRLAWWGSNNERACAALCDWVSAFWFHKGGAGLNRHVSGH